MKNDAASGSGRCMTLFAPIAVKRHRFLSNPLRVDLYTVEIVSRNIGGIKFT